MTARNYLGYVWNQHRLEMFQLVFVYFFLHQIDFYMRRHIRWYWYRLSIYRHLSHNLFEDTELHITFPDLSKSNADKVLGLIIQHLPHTVQTVWLKEHGRKRPMLGCGRKHIHRPFWLKHRPFLTAPDSRKILWLDLLLKNTWSNLSLVILD